jgi:hypothetical protein
LMQVIGAGDYSKVTPLLLPVTTAELVVRR